MSNVVLLKPEAPRPKRPKSSKTTAITSSLTTEWRSPPELVDIVKAVSKDGKIHLDPCGGPGSVVGAELEFRGYGLAREGLALDHPDDLAIPPDDPRRLAWGIDGLAADWHEVCPTGMIFVNYPWGDEAWVRKVSMMAAKGCEITMVAPPRVGSRWWHRHVLGRLEHPGKKADAGVYLCPRICYLRPDGTRETQPTMDTSLVYWGPRPGHFEDVTKAFGAPWRP